MTATVPTRMIALLGLAAAALAAFFLVVRPLLMDDSEATPASATNQPTEQPAAQPNVTPSKPAARPAARPAIVLEPGLPANVARALRRERVVVAAVWAPSSGDREAFAQARAGAQASGAGFVALNVLFEGHARALERLVGPISDPSVLVFKRPGKVANRLEGFADSATVAQAALNAGAR
jgi:hypothetical protein